MILRTRTDVIENETKTDAIWDKLKLFIEASTNITAKRTLGKMVTETAIAIQTAAGAIDAFLYRAEHGIDPGVIFLTDIFGIRPANREMARRLAEQGYTVMLPNIFYRTGTLPLFDFQPKIGEERTMKRFEELRGPLSPEAVEQDGAAYVDFLAMQDSVRSVPMGVVGYCFSGAMAVRIAAARPDRIAAGASFHGGGLYTDTPASPHLALHRVKAHLYFGHATGDRSMPGEAINKLDVALLNWGGEYESEVYDASHGWTVPGSPVYNGPQAEIAFQKLTQLFLPR